METITSPFSKHRDAASYNDHAAGYAYYIERLASPLAEHICQLADLKDGDWVLDVGCGSGIASRQAAKAVAPSGRVLGIDLSSGMVAAAQSLGSPAQAGSLHYRIMDAEALDVPTGSVDAILSLCAVLHFPNIARSLEEMHRVLKPGGRLVVSFATVRPHSSWGLLKHAANRLLRETLRGVRPYMGAPSATVDLVSRFLPPPPTPMNTEWSSHRPRQKLLDGLRAAGFSKIQSCWRGHDVLFGSAEEYWEAQTAIATALRQRLDSAPPDLVKKLRQIFIAKAQAVLDRGGCLIYSYGAFFVQGLRPENFRV